MPPGSAALALVLLSVQQPPSMPADLLVGVTYALPASAPAADVQQELERIRRAGFNLIVLPAKHGNVDGLVDVAIGAGLTIRAADDPGLARIAWAPAARGLQEARLGFWRAIAAGARAIHFADAGNRSRQQLLALGETAGVVTRNQSLFRELRPRERGVRSVEGGGPDVEIRILESDEALVIIGLNTAPTTRAVTVFFEPDIPEAIWQNFETGTSVSFVMGREGPFLEHTFAPRDALVLMVRKRYRR